MNRDTIFDSSKVIACLQEEMKKATDSFKGENGPQSPAYFFSTNDNDLLAIKNFKLIAGDGYAYNNRSDLHRALQVITHIAANFDKNFGKVPNIAIVVKHGNPCGAGISWKDDYGGAILKMKKGDPIAMFGGTVVCNFEINESLAKTLKREDNSNLKLLDLVVAPYITSDAITVLNRKGGRCKMLTNIALGDLNADSLDTNPIIKQVRGGFLIQPNYTYIPILKNATRSKKANRKQEENALLGDAICRTSNSNTIVIVNDGMLLGNGCGRQDRVSAAELAISLALRAGHKKIKGAVACSDSFFPFPDGPEVLIKAGIKMIMTTTGSVRDTSTIDACKDIILYTFPDSEARGFAWH